MKIAIIGGGWVGCHLAFKLSNDHDVVIFEKNEKLFQETSLKNQNRLHLGYHYPRSFKTRELCLNTFDRFLSEYPFLVKHVPNNWYCVENNKSILDYNTFLKIFEGQDHYEVVNIFKNIEGVINTSEKQIDFNAAHEFFNHELAKFHLKDEINKVKLKELSKKYNLVIDCTNNHLSNEKKENNFFESTVSYLYKKINPTPFDSLTVVDGPFFSIYPYKDDLYTVTDVEYTPLSKFKKCSQIKKYNEAVEKTNFLRTNSVMIENKINKYYSEFSKNFEYDSYFLSTKSKVINASDNRYPVISCKNNIIKCFTGKIQGIYIIEDFINQHIKQHERK